MTSDNFRDSEQVHRQQIRSLQQLSNSIQPTDHFVETVMDAADKLQTTKLDWLTSWMKPTSPANLSWSRVATAIVLMVAFFGAIPQYLRWIDAFLLGVSSDLIYEARTQETLWKKNFACATQLDQRADNYAAIAIDNVVVVTWACPSGDILVTLESPSDDASTRSVWIPLRHQSQTVSWLDGMVKNVFAASHTDVNRDKKSAQMVTVLCQIWLPDRSIKRRVKFANNRCMEEIINPRTGLVIKRQTSSCNEDCEAKPGVH